MNRSLIILLLVALVGPTSAACTTAPVLEARDARALPQGNIEVMRDSVLYALDSRGWRLEEEALGLAVATVRVGGHEATVEVTYDDFGYLIRHVRSSPGLKYRGDTVHKRYNRWVAALERSIRKRMRDLGY